MNGWTDAHPCEGDRFCFHLACAACGADEVMRAESAAALPVHRCPALRGETANDVPQAPPARSITIDRLIAVQVEVQLPEWCPSCGRHFDEADSLLEDQYVGSEQSASLTDDGPECSDFFENDIEPAFVVGYRCAECREILVSSQ